MAQIGVIPCYPLCIKEEKAILDIFECLWNNIGFFAERNEE